MRDLKGIAYESPLTLKEYIDDWRGSTRKKIVPRLITQGKIKPISEDVNLIFVLSFPLFQAYIEELNKSSAAVLVFDSPMVLSQVNIHIMDARESANMEWSRLNLDEDKFIAELTDMLKSKQTIDVNELNLDIDLIGRLLSSQGSITQTLLGVTMLCSSTGQRQRAIKTYINWLISGQSPEILKDELSNNKVKIDNDAVDNVINWFNSDDGISARVVSIKLHDQLSKGKEVNPEKIIKGTDVTPFDIGYLTKYMKVEENE